MVTLSVYLIDDISPGVLPFIESRLEATTSIPEGVRWWLF